MSALSRVVRSGVNRRWVQTTVITLATAAAVTAGLLGLGLLVASNAPFDHAFTTQHGAHLTVQTDATKATAGQLAATKHAAGVTEAAGPFAIGQAMVVPQPPPGMPGLPPGAHGPVLTVVARSGPGSGVDAVTLTEGRWAQQPDELVLATGDFRTPVGDTLTVGQGEDARDLKVVGLARSVSDTADAWLTPAGFTALHLPATGNEMLYRVADPDSSSQVDRTRDAVTAALPDGAVTSSKSWLTVKQEANDQTSIFVPFLLTFGGLSLLLSVLIVGTVIAGAVGSTIRRIGILKALGFTPSQVVRAYVAQALIPAAIGAVLGLVAGNLIAIPLLADTEDLYGTVALTIAWWVDVVVLLGVLALVTLTAALAAGRAGRLSAVGALAVGRTPAARRGQVAARFAARLPIPRPVSLGIARPFSAPVRAAAMVVAIAFGAAAVTLAAGLATSLHRVQVAADHSAAQVIVDGMSGPPGAEVNPAPGTEPPEPTVADPAKVAAVLDAQPGTAHWLGYAENEATVPGLEGETRLMEYTESPGWAGYELVTGRWFTKPGEAVVPTELLQSTDRKLGDTVTVTHDGTSSTLTIVGEVFDPGNNDGLILTEATSATTLTAWQIRVADGTDLGSYSDDLQQELDPIGLTSHVESQGADELLVIIDALAGLLTLMLVTVAGLGVLNAVVLDVRDRVHDIGIHKALGMTPRQTLTAVLSSVALIGLAGGVIGMPAGLVMHKILIPAMGHGAGVELPRIVMTVYGPAELAAFTLGGLALAVAGAMLPAGWAAKTRTATALRTE